MTLNSRNRSNFFKVIHMLSLIKARGVSIENDVILSPSRPGVTRAFMFPSSVNLLEDTLNHFYFADILLQAILKREGDFYTLNDITAFWRKHSSGIFGGLTDKNMSFIDLQRSQTNFWIAQYFYGQGDYSFARRYMVRGLNNLMSSRVGDKNRIMAYLVFNVFSSYVRKLANKVFNQLFLIQFFMMLPWRSDTGLNIG